MLTIRKTAPLALAAVLYAATICSAAASDSPASEVQEQRNKETVAAAFGRWAAGGSGFFEEILAPDVAWTIPGSSPVAGTYPSRDDFIARAVRPFARRLSGPIKPAVRNIWADGEHVIVHWDGAGTARDAELRLAGLDERGNRGNTAKYTADTTRRILRVLDLRPMITSAMARPLCSRPSTWRPARSAGASTSAAAASNSSI
jgi:uncharacterized protein